MLQHLLGIFALQAVCGCTQERIVNVATRHELDHTSDHSAAIDQQFYEKLRRLFSGLTWVAKLNAVQKTQRQSGTI